MRSTIIGITLLSLIMMGCEEAIESGGSANTSWNWPGHVVGTAIDFNIETSAGASVTGTINYRYDANGAVVGTNPESGRQYYPVSYTYTPNGNRATIRLDYGGGAYETYRLTASSCSTGTYTSESFDGFVSASSTGNYVITTSSCSGGGGGGTAPTVDYDQEPNDTRDDAVAVPSPVLVSGTVNSASDQNDYLQVTPTADGQFNITLSGYGSADLDLYLEDSAGGTIDQSFTLNEVESISFALSDGLSYYIRVHGFDTAGQTRAYALQISGGTADGEAGGGAPSYSGEWQQFPVISNGNLWLVINGSSVARCSTNVAQGSTAIKRGSLSGNTITWQDGSPSTTLSDLTATTMNYNWTTTGGNSGVYDFGRPVQVPVAAWCN